ncbi:MAG: hypothetical protein HS116_18705 [Planctomycetes bacterium]|nr:hypothetical protein [Planctomycetota bacterium]
MAVLIWLASSHGRGQETTAKAMAQLPIKIVGTASGGTVSLGFSGNPDALIAVETQANETAMQVAAKLAQKAEEVNLPHISLDGNSGLMLIANCSGGSVFYRSTDLGLAGPPNVSSFRCVSQKAGAKVTLSWTLPNPAPDSIFIYRSNHPLAVVEGTSTSYEDTKFNPAEPNGTILHSYAVVSGHERNADNKIERYSDIAFVRNVNNPEYMTNDTFHITNTGVGDGRLGKTYQWSLRKNGGVDPATWSLDSGALAPGLTISELGEIQGTASQKGAFTFTAKVTGANGVSTTKSLSMEIKD